MAVLSLLFSTSKGHCHLFEQTRISVTQDPSVPNLDEIIPKVLEKDIMHLLSPFRESVTFYLKDLECHLTQNVLCLVSLIFQIEF